MFNNIFQSVLNNFTKQTLNLFLGVLYKRTLQSQMDNV